MTYIRSLAMHKRNLMLLLVFGIWGSLRLFSYDLHRGKYGCLSGLCWNAPGLSQLFVHGMIMVCVWQKQHIASLMPSETSRGIGLRIHCGIEVTASSTNKQHTHSLSTQVLLHLCSERFLYSGKASQTFCRGGIHFGISPWMKKLLSI
jgi:hypothetical protein